MANGLRRFYCISRDKNGSFTLLSAVRVYCIFALVINGHEFSDAIDAETLSNDYGVSMLKSLDLSCSVLDMARNVFHFSFAMQDDYTAC